MASPTEVPVVWAPCCPRHVEGRRSRVDGDDVGIRRLREDLHGEVAQPAHADDHDGAVPVDGVAVEPDRVVRREPRVGERCELGGGRCRPPPRAGVRTAPGRTRRGRPGWPSPQPTRPSRLRQWFSWPRRQLWHVPHDQTPCTTASRPSQLAATPSPTSTTVPATSWPSVIGSAYGRVPGGQYMTCRSEWHRPTASTRSRSSPGPGRGTGTSRTSGSRCHAVSWTARIERGGHRGLPTGSRSVPTVLDIGQKLN